MQQPTNSTSDALCEKGRKIGGEGNNQNQMEGERELGWRLFSAAELFLTM